MVLELIKSGYKKVKAALAKTGSLLGDKIREIFKGKVDEDMLDELEQLLYEADLGVATTMELVDKVRSLAKENPSIEAEAVVDVIRQELLAILKKIPQVPETEESPRVVLIVGVNGNGKTTSIAKLANLQKLSGKKVILGAADTFRAAAVQQLEMWSQRLDVDIVKGQPNADPAAVAFDTVQAAKSRGCEVAFIDTAGRLHTKTNLMHELAKIRRSCAKVLPGSPHETYLVVDATTGQNAVDQAKTFHEHAPLSGLVLTKLDGSAKGGIVIAIQRELGIPVKYLGVGEGMEDLQIFEPEAFVETLLQGS